MDAPVAVLWVWSVFFAIMAASSAYRLALAGDLAGRRAGIDRVDEAADLLMCLGMLAMVSPLGGPVPLAGWRAIFVAAAVALGAAWWRRRRSLSGSTRCGHHAVMAAAMAYMLIAVPHDDHPADPWLTMSGHGGSLEHWPLAVAALVYCAVDIAVGVPRVLRAPAGQGIGGERARAVSRVAGSAGMGAMLAVMM